MSLASRPRRVPIITTYTKYFRLALNSPGQTKELRGQQKYTLYSDIEDQCKIFYTEVIPDNSETVDHEEQDACASSEPLY